MLKHAILGLLLLFALPLWAEDEALDLDFSNAPVTHIIEALATIAQKNVVVSDTVVGQMSLHVKKMNWPEALNLVLQSQALSLKTVGDTWYISKTDDMLIHTKTQVDALQQNDLAADLITDFLHLHYARAKELQILLLQDKSLFSARGMIVVDTRTNTIVVTDTADHVKAVEAVVAALDVPVQQIHIEARIVEVNKSALQSLGVMLGTGAVQAMGALGSVNQANINLSIENPAGSLAFGLAHLSSGVLNLELQALETSGDGKVISAPELTVSDDQEAYIEEGSEVPYRTSTSSGATQIEFRKAVLGLKVVPHLTEKGQIQLHLQVNKDSISNLVSPVGTVPIINTSEVNTDVLVTEGETIVLGGIYSEEHLHDLRGIPILSGIPGVGFLFRSHHDADKYTDLLIFVTPSLAKIDVSNS